MTAPSTPPILRLPYELHEKIALYLSAAQDAISLSQTCQTIRSRLLTSNPVWFRALHFAGSEKQEYVAYNPKVVYRERVLRIRARKRLRCQICLRLNSVRTVDVNGAFYGVYCGDCLQQRFYDIQAFESLQDMFWDGIVNPPQFTLPEVAICKGYRDLYRKRNPEIRGGFMSTDRMAEFVFSGVENPIRLVLKADATKLLDAAMDDDAIYWVKRHIEARNERLEKEMRERHHQAKEDVLDYLVENYEDEHSELHEQMTPETYRQGWSLQVSKIFGLNGGLPPRRGDRSGGLQMSWVGEMLLTLGTFTAAPVSRMSFP
ncbi:hypothetical protein H072_5359 [Dactylellina haptotyla CBS 200.50]|uniref:F-box domain-containing protein n=1 Tax=Dactylellina haptotyla (strain CBS 200.50) TaxID=1284197 RepID=S8ACP9_DACHA|nr:hypothetical protein H072_5359 [Dactylellina haptotyla CBS 200.50]